MKASRRLLLKGASAIFPSTYIGRVVKSPDSPRGHGHGPRCAWPQSKVRFELDNHTVYERPGPHLDRKRGSRRSGEIFIASIALAAAPATAAGGGGCRGRGVARRHLLRLPGRALKPVLRRARAGQPLPRRLLLPPAPALQCERRLLGALSRACVCGLQGVLRFIRIQGLGFGDWSL